MQMTGLLSIPGGILCQKDVLGKQFCGSISGIKFDIEFPSLADGSEKDSIDCVGMTNQLIAPPSGASLARGEEIAWGYPTKFPSMSSFVEHVTVKADCAESEADGLAQELYTGIDEWTYSFKSFLQLVTKQPRGRNSKVVSPGQNLELLFDRKYIENHQPTTICVTIHDENIFASSKDIEQAINFASSGKELLLEYQLLLSAYDARKDEKNRQAIVDACSAIEICLTNWIKNYCNSKGLDPEILTEKYRSLGERFKLVSKLDSNFPSFDFNNIIVKPRNDVAHNRDIYPSNECTNQLIELIEKYLAHYHTTYY